MKIKLLILIIVLCLGFQTVSAQTEKQVTAIRAEVAGINKNVTKYKKTTKSVEGISLEGTEGIFYSSGADLKKVTAKIYGEMYRATAEIYYKNNVPIFVYQKLSKYDKPFNLSPKIARVEQMRVYYVDGQIIRILVGKKEIKPTDEQFEDRKKEFDGFGDEFFKAFKG
jgi:hypothetical protein